MSETWVSREELVEVMGDVGAVILCAQCGGRKCFVPLKAGGFLLDLLGPGGPSFSVRPLEACTSSCPTCAVGGRSKSASYHGWKPGRSRTPSQKPSA